jgi:hypothetical protein
MIKRFIHILLLTLILSPLTGAISFPTNLSLDMLNDGISFGIGDNPDDLRSYGASISIGFPSKWNGSIELTGFTLRNNEAPEEGRRFDEILVTGGKEFSFRTNLLPNILVYDISLQGGLAFAGNLGFSEVQNAWHEVNGIELVHLAYCSNTGLNIYPYFPLSHSISVYAPSPWFSYTNILFKVENEIVFAPGYRKSISGSLTLGHITTYDKYFTFSFGFTDTDILNSWPLHNKVAESESGLFFKLDGRMGMLNFLYSYYFPSYKGYGGVGINLGFDRVNDHYYSTNDLIFSVGAQVFTNMLTERIRYAVNSEIGIYVSNSFKSRILAYDDNLRQMTSKWHAGIDYQFTQFSNDLLIPFASFGGGLKRIIVHGDRETTLGERVLYADRLTYLFNGEIGARFFHDGRFKIGSVIYGLEVALGMDYSPMANLQAIIDQYHLIVVEDFHPRLRIALFTAGSL